MQHPLSTELTHPIDYSSFDDTINLEEFLHNKNLTLTKLFALLRLWNKPVHNHFAKLIFLVCKKIIEIYRKNLFDYLDTGKRD
jgi:hypothetical protein